MKNLLTNKEIENFKTDGAIILRKKFDISWIKKLKTDVPTTIIYFDEVRKSKKREKVGIIK